MYHKVLLFSLLLALSLPTNAGDLMYGIAVINQDVDISIDTGSGTPVTTTEDGSGYGVFADMYYRSTYRFNGAVSYVDYTDFYIISATASADYLIPINDRFTFFAGVTGGAISQKYSDSSISDIALSYLAGAQLGGIMVAGKHLMVELGYRQRATNLETELTNLSATATVEEITETYISLNIIF